jgi:hypothetical protein
MQQVHSFEYAIIRIVPRVEREEFVNVGVILYCKSLQFLKVKIEVDEKRLHALFRGAELEELKEYLNAFAEVAEVTNTRNPIAKLDMASRFRWLTATRSTTLQTSRVHPGMCDNPAGKLEKLFAEYVL